MSGYTRLQLNARPFLKWAGGKTQLLSTIERFLPADFNAQKDITYIEPFVGGGAMLFFMLQRFPAIKNVVINDINGHLINTYKAIRDYPKQLISLLRDIAVAYNTNSDYDDKKNFYLQMHKCFNNDNLSMIEDAAYMIFLNRTCFNGLYRENAAGKFNVPFGRYVNPAICDEEIILTDSELLQNVSVLNDDFSQIANACNGYTFIYFDPPYRPLDATSSFNSYVKQVFDDSEQIRLSHFIKNLTDNGCRILLSNSDCKGRNAADNFFDDLYKDFYIERVIARRSINANPSKRGTLTELLIRNYKHCLASL